MNLKLYAHPFSSYSWKVQIPLAADGTDYTYLKVPVLVDGDTVIAETSCIIEYLQVHHPGPNVWIPDGDLGLRVRFLDRFFDNHVQGNMQHSVNHAIWPDGEGKAAARGIEAPAD